MFRVSNRGAAPKVFAPKQQGCTQGDGGASDSSAAVSLFLILAVFLGGMPSPIQAAERSPLMPRPQEIQYGPGQIRVRGLVIKLPPKATAEDKFAANTLSACLTRQAGAPVSVVEGGGDGRIVLKRTGGMGALPVPGEQPGPQSREAYWLSIRPDGVELRAASTAGLFYGARTICQLVRGVGDRAALPEVKIHDWPWLAYRGTMFDMSHGPLPTENEIKRQLDFLSLWKANQYYLYSEASIELEGFPLINSSYGSSYASNARFTEDEIRRIVAYGRERHIDVIPCLELYGHLHDLFRIEKYSDLADLPHGTEFDPRNPNVLRLLSNWAHQFAQLFPSPFVHIGFDETFQIEIAARQAGIAANPANLFIKQLRDVAQLFQQQGKTVMAWGDIMVKYPEIIQELPPGLISVAWEYDPGPEQHYQHWLGPLVAHHVPHIVATGVTGWNQIVPDFARSFENIDTFLAAGRKSHALGIMNTIWTDDAQMLMRMTWPGIAYGAIAAWQSAVADPKTFFSAYSELVYPQRAAPEIASALNDMAQSELAIQKVLGDESMLALWNNFFNPTTLKKCSENRDALRETRLLAEEAEEHLVRALSFGADAASLRSLLFGCRLLDYAGQKFQTAPELIDMWRKLGPKRPKDQVWWNEWESQVTYPDHSRLADLLDAITELRDVYRSEWLAEYTPYRLASALGRWDAEYEFWRQLQARLMAFSGASREGDTLPPLESFAPSK